MARGQLQGAVPKAVAELSRGRGSAEGQGGEWLLKWGHVPKSNLKSRYATSWRAECPGTRLPTRMDPGGLLVPVGREGLTPATPELSGHHWKSPGGSEGDDGQP